MVLRDTVVKVDLDVRVVGMTLGASRCKFYMTFNIVCCYYTAFIKHQQFVQYFTIQSEKVQKYNSIQEG